MTNLYQTFTLNFEDKFYANRKAFRAAIRRFAETHSLYYTNEKNHYYFTIDGIEYEVGYNDHILCSYISNNLI